MAAPPIDPVSDSRVQHKTAKLNGYTYHYLYAVPQSGEYVGTVMLIHGWPDISMGWRYQIPYLVELGFRVVAPDMMGYGGTDAPKCPPNSITLYGLKRASDDIAALAKEVGAPQIILGGHDWGGAVIWRAAQRYPDIISHVFSVCTPYTPPHEQYHSIQELTRGPLPQLGYQIQLASGEVEKFVKDEQSIRQFLKGAYGAKGPNREPAFIPATGVQEKNLPLIGESKILNGPILDYYVQQYSRHGIHSTLNWYRQRKTNWEEDQELLNRKVIHQPVLFIQANRDDVLKPGMSQNMETFIPNMQRGQVDASHWALTETPQDVNKIIGEWLGGFGFGKTKSSL